MTLDGITVINVFHTIIYSLQYKAMIKDTHTLIGQPDLASELIGLTKDINEEAEDYNQTIDRGKKA